MHKESKLTPVVWIREARNASAEFEAQPCPERLSKSLWHEAVQVSPPWQQAALQWQRPFRQVCAQGGLACPFLLALAPELSQDLGICLGVFLLHGSVPAPASCVGWSSRQLVVCYLMNLGKQWPVSPTTPYMLKQPCPPGPAPGL